MFGKILSTFIAGLAVASAYTQPVGDPSGNPIAKPGLNEIVPVGVPYTVTWTPTTTGTVTIVLLRGPSTNVLPLYPIAEGIENTGTFQWTPSTDLEDDVTHYGLQLIVDATGQYQYTTQFGISNPSKASGSASASGTGSSQSTAPAVTVNTGTAYSSITYSASSTPISNVTVVQPTVPLTVPSTLQSATPTAKTSAPLQATGAAHKMAAGFGGAAVAFIAAVAAL
jgi:hypothetical protein